MIEETFVRHGEIYELRIGGRVIRVTPEHPLYVDGQGWTPAAEVVRGDRLATIRLPVGAACDQPAAVGVEPSQPPQPWPSHTQPAQPDAWAADWLEVESNGSTGEFTTVYNFRVAHWHTYFVGHDGWGLWVHNSYKIETGPVPQLVRGKQGDRVTGILEWIDPETGARKWVSLSSGEEGASAAMGFTRADFIPGAHGANYHHVEFQAAEIMRREGIMDATLSHNWWKGDLTCNFCAPGRSPVLLERAVPSGSTLRLPDMTIAETRVS